MFKAANPYDEKVTKATAETLTSEDWQINLEICDEISTQGESGARNCIASIQKRLIHRNVNVQLYSLTLADSIAKNCGVEAHRELASRAFTQVLVRLLMDRNTHDKVKSKIKTILKEWQSDFTAEETSSMIKETIDSLENQGVHITSSDYSERLNEDTTSAPPPEPSSEQLRREDEELRRVLELSIQDQGGRNQGHSQTQYDTGSFASASASASGSNTNANTNTSNRVANTSTAPNQAQESQSQSQSQASGALGVDKNLPDPNAAAAAAVPATSAQKKAPSRVRALYDFAPSEIGELAFQKGDLIRVLDSVYEHWWRGELRGEAGIFPVNYVEILPDPTPLEIQREAEQEAKIFMSAHDIDLLLSKLRQLSTTNRGDNLMEDEEIQDLYQSVITMRPKIVKLIDKYSVKVQELKSLNDKFVNARGLYDSMLQQPSQQVGYHPQQQQQQQQYYPQQQQQQQQPQQQQQQYSQQTYPQQQQHSQQAYPQQQPQSPYPQQQPQTQSQYGQQPQYAPQHAQHAQQGPSAVQQGPSAGADQPQYYGAQQQPQEDEKRRLYEQARREAEAYQAAYGGGGGSNAGAGAGASGSGSQQPQQQHQQAYHQQQASQPQQAYHQ